MTVVIPAYNERRRLGPTLEAVSNFLAAQSYEADVIVVDDGSTDGTPELVEAHQRRDPNIHLVRNPGNCGKGYAVRHGMLEARGEWILFSDADLSTPIEELAKLLSAAQSAGAAVAIGSRAVNRSLVSIHQSVFREASGRIFNLLVRTITALQFCDTQCGFKLYRKDAAKQIFRLQQLDGFSFDVEDLFLAKRQGLRIIEVPVRWANVEGTKVSFTKGMQSFLDLVRIRWYHVSGRYRAVCKLA